MPTDPRLDETFIKKYCGERLALEKIPGIIEFKSRLVIASTGKKVKGQNRNQLLDPKKIVPEIHRIQFPMRVDCFSLLSNAASRSGISTGFPITSSTLSLNLAGWAVSRKMPV